MEVIASAAFRLAAMAIAYGSPWGASGECAEILSRLSLGDSGVPEEGTLPCPDDTAAAIASSVTDRGGCAGDAMRSVARHVLSAVSRPGHRRSGARRDTLGALAAAWDPTRPGPDACARAACLCAAAAGALRHRLTRMSGRGDPPGSTRRMVSEVVGFACDMAVSASSGRFHEVACSIYSEAACRYAAEADQEDASCTPGVFVVSGLDSEGFWSSLGASVSRSVDASPEMFVSLKTPPACGVSTAFLSDAHEGDAVTMHHCLSVAYPCPLVVVLGATCSGGALRDSWRSFPVVSGSTPALEGGSDCRSSAGLGVFGAVCSEFEVS